MAINLQNKDRASTLNVAGDKLGTFYMTQNPKYYEIQRNNNFAFYVDLSNFFTETDLVGNTYARTNATEVLKLSVASSSVPHFTQSVIEVKRGNTTMKFAGVPTFGEGNIKLDDWIGAGTKDILLAWQKKSYNVQTEKVGLASDYKRLGYLLEYTPDYQLVRTWVLEGCWISGISEDNFDHDSNDKHALNAVIQYDRAYPDVSDIED